MLDFQRKYGGNVHSQNGEDLIVSEALRRMQIETGKVVEIGANDGLWLSNSRHLIEHGWSAVLVETQFELWKKAEANWAHRPDVKCICSHVDQYNVNAFVKDDCDVLSTDTDGSDYAIFKGLKRNPRS